MLEAAGTNYFAVEVEIVDLRVGIGCLAAAAVPYCPQASGTTVKELPGSNFEALVPDSSMQQCHCRLMGYCH